MTPRTDVALAPLCTMRVGGAARYYTSARTESEVRAALGWAVAHAVPVQILGGGSNVVIADAGIDGLVIHVTIDGIDMTTSGASATCRVGAGEPWDPFVAATVSQGCAGLECLSGIPGFVGGTPVQNVGAYGQEVSSTISAVHAVDRVTGTTVSLASAECDFGYRASRFKHADAGRYVVTGVTFVLARDGRPTVRYGDVIEQLEATHIHAPTLHEVRDAVLSVRRRKGMVIEPDNPAGRSCGSFFVNPVVSRDTLTRIEAAAGVDAAPHFAVSADAVKVPAAWLIERAGFPKGTTRGAVGISPFQAQAIINRGGATAHDVLMLACEVKQAVWNVFGVAIVPEPILLGFTPSPELRLLLTSHPGH